MHQNFPGKGNFRGLKRSLVDDIKIACINAWPDDLTCAIINSHITSTKTVRPYYYGRPMDEKKSFKDTLNLPKTDFSIRAEAQKKEPEIMERWKAQDLYKKACSKNSGNKKFVLHDGPPFANGHMHMGHALNRTLKDIVCKTRRMSGDHVVSVPGWDCHGLPVELKVLKEFELDKRAKDFDRVDFKKKCRVYAQKWIDVQKEEVKRLGVVTDWDNPYITMSPRYEAGILRCLATFVEKGYVERKEKTVPWCASCQSALAISEIEYEDKKDPSCYILFSLDQSESVFSDVLSKNPGVKINLLIWTTTPWTIPLNRAVVLNTSASYVLLQSKDDQAFIVGEKLADKVCSEIGLEKKILKTFSSSLLKGKQVNHPYVENLKVPVVLDDMVLLEEGTACVHSAPGCGPEDYLIGIKNGLEIFSPISQDGKYTKGIKPVELDGMSVFDGQIWSIRKMSELGRLLHKGSIVHQYPHCWRCHQPLIFRATEQWFCDLEKDNLITRAIEDAGKLKYVPDWGKNRLTASMASRAEWCLSRQNQWGTPIPAVTCKKCKRTYVDAKFIRLIASGVEKEGIEYWDIVSLEELKYTCNSCGSKDLQKEMDIVDVWFESGVSHTVVQEQNNEMTIPADVYLEGSDQHRGWFQSSHLSSMIMHNKPCTKAFVTHAYVLDVHAQKMSKSKGNVTSPQDIVNNYSADILRLWVAASDFEGNILISDTVLKNVAEVYRKIRNTCRFMLSNLYDFDYEKDAVAVEKLPILDQLALIKLQEVIVATKSAYDAYWFTNVFHTLNKYCTNDLSAFYLDIIKDRLYTEKADGHLRRSAQTVIFNILDVLTKLMAPILSFLSEEVSDCYEKNKTESIHLKGFPEQLKISLSKQIVELYSVLENIRPEILKAIEEEREKEIVKHSLEAKIVMYIDSSHEEGKKLLAFIDQVKSKEDVIRFFKDFVIVSQFEFAKNDDDCKATALPWLKLKVVHADGIKCPRCWQWDTTKHEDALCKRCEEVI